MCLKQLYGRRNHSVLPYMAIMYQVSGVSSRATEKSLMIGRSRLAGSIRLQPLLESEAFVLGCCRGEITFQNTTAQTTFGRGLHLFLGQITTHNTHKKYATKYDIKKKYPSVIPCRSDFFRRSFSVFDRSHQSSLAVQTSSHHFRPYLAT